MKSISTQHCNLYTRARFGIGISVRGNGQRFTPEQQSVLNDAKRYQKIGCNELTAENLLRRARAAGLSTRGPESHPTANSKTSQQRHIHIGNIDHIPVKFGQNIAEKLNFGA